MSDGVPLPPAGWYPDPSGGAGERWWDGTAWTDYRREVAPPVAPTPLPVQPVQPVQAAPQPATVSTPSTSTYEPAYAASAAGRTPRRRWLLPVVIGVPAAVVVIVVIVLAVILIPRLIGGGEPQYTASQARSALLDTGDADQSELDPLVVPLVTDDASVTTEDVPTYASRFTPSTTTDPARCAGPLGYAAWDSFDTDDYSGYRSDQIFENQGGSNTVQAARYFLDADAAQRFVQLQRDWYDDCSHIHYGDTDTGTDYDTQTLPATAGTDSVVAYTETTSSDGITAGIDIYERRGNVVLMVGSAGVDGAEEADMKAAGERLATAMAKQLAGL